MTAPDPSPTVLILAHTALALIAVPLGVWMLARPKPTSSVGGAAHRALGRVWAGLMALVALTSFGIQSINSGSYSWIHLLSVWTLISLAVAIFAIRRGDRRRHQYFMIGLFAGLIGAGLFTLLPGRLLHIWIFG